MKYLVALIFFFSAGVSFSDDVNCPLVSFAKLKADLKGKGEVNIIFFASWCMSCKPHLSSTHNEKTIFVAAFDEQKRAEKTINAFGQSQACYTSDDTAKHLGVRSLPAKKTYVF